MSLRDHDAEIKKEYRTLKHKVVQCFYIPLLQEAVSYKRGAGYFSSKALVEVSQGIATMAERGGHIQIVASPMLSTEDIEAIQKGYADRKKIVENAVLRGLLNEPKDYYSMERLNLLACLIAEGILDIRIADLENLNDLGIYHEKVGIIEDAEGNRVAFSGSMNETLMGMKVNYEVIDIYCSWRNDDNRDRIELKCKAFDSIWNNHEENITVYDFNSVSEEIIRRFKRKPPNYSIDKEEFGHIDNHGNDIKPTAKENAPIGARIPKDVNLYDYQKSAIEAWASENYRGIFDMATGTGKTLTGLGAIAKLSQDLDDRLAVMIVCPYQHLVEQWVEDITRFNIKPIIGYSSSPQKDWKNRLKQAILDSKIRENKRFFCFVCTNATFTSEYVQKQILKIKNPILLVVDEAHNFGSQSNASLLDDRFKYRLALSATIERFRDEEGTNSLYRFFGKKCIEYTLERAIAEDKLTKYFYYPVVVYLTEEELDKYESISYEMSRCLIKGKDGKTKLNKYGEILAIKRARIVAGAQEKLTALKEQMMPYVKDGNILVYCGTSDVNDDMLDEEIRQIEAVTRILGNELEMKVAMFTSRENIETRSMIKKKFVEPDGLQAIVAIKCLDEGVNIPGIKTAFILASSTNPKEYIQRRGRVLRKAEHKDFAEIYDFVTLPRSIDSVPLLTTYQAERDKTLVKNELMRIKEFSRLAENKMDSLGLIWDLKEVYHFEDNELIGEFTYD